MVAGAVVVLDDVLCYVCVCVRAVRERRTERREESEETICASE